MLHRQVIVLPSIIDMIAKNQTEGKTVDLTLINNPIPHDCVESTLLVLEKFEFERMNIGSSWPKMSDLEGASLNLARIQYMYMLDPVDMANGILGPVITNARLTWQDCVFLGQERVKPDLVPAGTSISVEYAGAITWFEAALRLLAKQESTEKTENAIKEVKKDLEHYKRLVKVHFKLDDYISYLQICFQHDKNFVPMVHGSGPSNEPSIRFFISKFEENPELTAMDLRAEEDKVFLQERFSVDPEHGNYFERDFQHLCRGLKLVKFLVGSHLAPL